MDAFVRGVHASNSHVAIYVLHAPSAAGLHCAYQELACALLRKFFVILHRQHLNVLCSIARLQMSTPKRMVVGHMQLPAVPDCPCSLQSLRLDLRYH